MSSKTHWIMAAAAFTTLLGSTAVLAETVSCKVITAVPHTIATPGHYCLRQTLYSDSTEPAITIAASGVLLDLNGHRLEKTSDKTSAIGVYAVDQLDLKILNGTIRGFSKAVFLAEKKGGSIHNLVEGIRAQANLETGIRVEGSQSIVRRCVVENSGDSDEYFTPGIGIHVLGKGHRVVDNDISATVGSANGDAIVVEKADGVIVQGNRIYHAFRCGILILDGTHLVVGNLVTHAYSFGIFIVNEGPSKYGDNIVQLAARPYAGGTDIGNNR